MPLLSLGEIASPIVRTGFDYWRNKIRGDQLPRRGDIEPAEIPKLLPHIMLTEIRLEPFRAYYRLAGTALAEIYGLDYTGSELSPELESKEGYEYYAGIYRRLCREKRPLFGRDSVHHSERNHVTYEWGEMPLVDERGDVVMGFALGEVFRHASPART